MKNIYWIIYQAATWICFFIWIKENYIQSSFIESIIFLMGRTNTNGGSTIYIDGKGWYVECVKEAVIRWKSPQNFMCLECDDFYLAVHGAIVWSLSHYCTFLVLSYNFGHFGTFLCNLLTDSAFIWTTSSMAMSYFS